MNIINVLLNKTKKICLSFVKKNFSNKRRLKSLKMSIVLKAGFIDLLIDNKK